MNRTEEAEYSKVLGVPAGKPISRRFLRRKTSGIERKSLRGATRLAFWNLYLENHPEVMKIAEENRAKLRPKVLTGEETSGSIESAGETAVE